MACETYYAGMKSSFRALTTANRTQNCHILTEKSAKNH